jgi:hypothetical protein
MAVTFSGGFNGIIKKIGNAIKLTIKAHFIFLCERRFEFFLNRKYSCSLVIRSKLGQGPSACRWAVGDSPSIRPHLFGVASLSATVFPFSWCCVACAHERIKRKGVRREVVLVCSFFRSLLFHSLFHSHTNAQQAHNRNPTQPNPTQPRSVRITMITTDHCGSLRSATH